MTLPLSSSDELDDLFEEYRKDYAVWEKYGLEDDKDETDLLAQARIKVERLISQEAARQTKGVLNELNKELFYSTTEPDGQFVKDKIIEKLDAMERQRLAALTKGGDDE